MTRVTGVEFSQSLCQKAEQNLTAFVLRASSGADLSWAVIHDDASTFRIPRDATLFFLYNPFSPPVLDTVAQHIHSHAATAAGPVLVIYVNPVHGFAFEQLGFSRLPESNAEVCYYVRP